MGNWDSYYYEVMEEMTEQGTKNRFMRQVHMLSQTQEYKYSSVREKWGLALQMINNEQ